MIRETFVHMQGIGQKTELRLWASGALDWRDLSETPIGRRREIAMALELSETAYRRRDLDYFFSRLPPAEKWRTFADYGRQFASLDIETTGLTHYDSITVIGIEVDGKYSRFVQGLNLEDAAEVLESTSGLMTFNGAAFDLPFIRRTFPGIRLPRAHLDLRFPARRAGLKGGLKNIERSLGIGRREDIQGMNGYDAVILWDRHQRGDAAALNRLIEYNRADVVNLRILTMAVVRRLLAGLMDRVTGSVDDLSIIDTLKSKWNMG